MNDEPGYLRIRTWGRYQLYKDGRPTKFFYIWTTTDETHTGILDDPSFLRLANKAPVFRMMALAARTGNKIPNDEEYLERVLGTERPVNVTEMLDYGFLEVWQQDERVGDFVYIAQSESTGLIKIGFTTNPMERMRQLRCGLIGLMRGDRGLERELHARFERVAAKQSEWFYPDEELLQLAAENCELVFLFDEEKNEEKTPGAKTPLNHAGLVARTSIGDARTQNRLEEKREEKEKASVEMVYGHWRSKRHKLHGRYDRITDNRRKKIVARLREFSADELKRAIDAVALDPWEDRSRHDDIVILFRNEEQVQKFLALAEDDSVLDAEERQRRHLERLRSEGKVE